MEHITVETMVGISAQTESELLSVCKNVFEQFDPAYLQSRLAHVVDPTVSSARDTQGDLVGFKLGYRIGPDLFFSWLGGVHPEYRRRGIARQLMSEQHAWCLANGYTTIETRTRASNSPMIVLNLRTGFVIHGYELNTSNTAVVIQRMPLG